MIGTEVEVLLRRVGERLDAIENRFRRVADAGDTNMMNRLGAMLEERGELTEAETWFRKGASAGNTAAMNNLGRMLKRRGELTEAETWFRRAKDEQINGGKN